MKSLRIAVAILGMLAATFAEQASAVPLTYNFGVHFDNGPLSGVSYFGALTTDSNDCPANRCTGIFTPGSVANTLLSFSINVAGFTFTANSDGGFPVFPRVGFDNTGRLSSIDFDGVVAGNELIIFGNLLAPNNLPALAAFDPAVGLTSTGTAFAAPEPGTGMLLGAALLLGLAFRRRSRDGAR